MKTRLIVTVTSHGLSKDGMGAKRVWKTHLLSVKYKWLANTWKDAQHHSLSEKCKSKPLWGSISHQSEWLPSKSLQAINAGEGVDKREPSCTGGNVHWYSHCGKQYGGAFKIRTEGYHVTKQSYSWAYIQRKPELKQIHAPQCPLQCYVQ